MVDSVLNPAPKLEIGEDKKLQESQKEKELKFFGDDGFTFTDFVDIVNPLQHIPLISTIYREISDDKLEPGSRLIGGTIFGGPIGLAASTFNVLLEQDTGKDLGKHVVSLFKGDEDVNPEANREFASTTGEKSTEPSSEIFPNLTENASFENEQAALAAGEASLKLANLDAFLNPGSATPAQPATVQVAQTSQARGSLGVFQGSQTTDPFALASLNRTANATPSNGGETVESFFTRRSTDDRFSPITSTSTTTSSDQVATASFTTPTQASSTPTSSNAGTSTIEQNSLSALQAYAQDIKQQRLEQQQQEKTAQQGQQTAPQQKADLVANQQQNDVFLANRIATSVSHLNQVQDNAWFAEALTQNFNSYTSLESAE